MTLLITGGTGLVGQALVRYLMKETPYVYEPHKIRLLIRKKRGNPQRQRFIDWCEKTGIDLVWGDLRFDETIRAFSQVTDPNSSILIHAGAIFNLWQPFDQLYDINVNGTRRILKAFDQSSIKKLIYISSVAVYGCMNGGNQGVTEEYPINLQMKENYELSKALGEDLVQKYHVNNPDKLITILRPSGIIGGSSSTLDVFSRMFFGRFVPLPRGGKDKISLVDTVDVARAIIFFANFNRGNGEIYNLVSCTPTLREVVQELGKALQKERISIISIPLFMFKPMYYIARLIRKVKRAKENSMLLPMLFDKLGQDIWIDSEKVKSIGFQYTIDLSESMKRFRTFIVENPWYVQNKLNISL
ncbi:MAG: NAD(P)-dependent oxidoreductase [Candidatus Heimdallarchaeota archaeon]|nr:MAG: NAD(P)-dependent oxidoreductase [Candidatus Heimdallarchaeota archaeon]